MNLAHSHVIAYITNECDMGWFFIWEPTSNKINFAPTFIQSVVSEVTARHLL